MEKSYKIEGMTCSACSSAVQKAIAKVPGVEISEVNLLMNQATVTMNESVTDTDILDAIVNAGYEGSTIQENKELDLDIEGMTCANCSLAVEKALQKQMGVQSVEVNLITNQAHVEFNPGLIKTPEI